MPENQLTPSHTVQRKSGFVEAEIDGEIVTLDIEKGTCGGLNCVGSSIWKMIAHPSRIEDICATLVGKYKVEPADCERQVLDFLEELRAEGMISISSEK